MPRKGLTFSPSLVVVALLTVVILAFGAYLAIQVLRFTKPPTVSVTQPSRRRHRCRRHDDDVHARGDVAPGRHGLDRHAGPRPAAGDRRLDRGVGGRRRSPSRAQPVRREARDPDTGKTSEETIHLFITVPFLVIEAPTLTVDQPAEGASFENGAIPVGGHATNAKSVVVSAKYVEPVGAASRGRRRDSGTAPDAAVGHGPGRR